MRRLALSGAVVVVLLGAGPANAVVIGSLAAWGWNDDAQVAPLPPGDDFVDIAAGWKHSLALRSDGTLVSWGNSTYVPSGEDFVDVTAGELHSVALSADGWLVSWGNSTYVPSGNDFVAVEAGESSTVALRNDGTLEAWGSNNYGQLEVPADIQGQVQEIAGGGHHTLALLKDGSLAAFGRTDEGQCDVPLENDFVAIGVGNYQSFAKRADGSWVSWGNNTNAECNIPPGTYSSITGGKLWSAGLRTDGSIEAWGVENEPRGRLDVPSGNDFGAIALGHSHGLAIQLPEPPQKYDLPVKETHGVGSMRAEQGIAFSEDAWYTSMGSLVSKDQFSKFDAAWQEILGRVDIDAGTVPIDGTTYEVDHIGDIAYAAPSSSSSSYVYAPIQVDVNPWNPFKDLKEMIAQYKSSDLSLVEAWDVPKGDDGKQIQLAGLEYKNGELWGVEHNKKSGNARILVFDEVDLWEDGSQPVESETFTITTEYANGIALLDDSDDYLYVSAGWPVGFYTIPGVGVVPRWPKGWIDVFDMDVLQSAAEPVEPYKRLTYQVPIRLHGEGLTFKDRELWVAKGDDVARLDTTKLPMFKSTAVVTSGSWNAETSWDKMVPDANTVVNVIGSILQVDGIAEALDIIIDSGGAVVLQTQGTMTLADTLDIRDGVYSIQGGSLAVAKILIGQGGDGSLEITDASAEVIVSEALILGASGSLLTAVPGSILHMTGSDFQNESTSPAEYADMINLTMLFEGGEGVIDSFEIGGVDMGPTVDGETANFGLGTLELGGVSGIGQLLLVDLFDNQPGWDGIEAQYLQNLIVAADSTLYLNGKNLYVGGLPVSAGEGGLYGGGTILAIPEPSALVLLSIAAVALLARGWRRRRAT